MSCRSGCPTGGHATWGECARAASINIGYCGIGGGDATVQKQWDRERQAYRDARRQGVQPATTKMRDIRRAMEISEKTGKAYDAAAGQPPLEL